MRLFCLATACVLVLGQPFSKAVAATLRDQPDLQLATLIYSGGNDNPRPHGLPRLVWELRKRTSVATSLKVARVDPASDALFNYPLTVWQGDAAFAPLPPAAIANLRHYLYIGGSLLVDVSDGQADSPFYLSVRRELLRVFADGQRAPGPQLQRIPANHVVYKSFYLVDRHGGRVPVRPYLEGIFVDKRLAVLVSANDLAGAMARGEFGAWDYDVGPGGATTREMTFRLGINWVMYALCLDYKEDQVHIPFILKRRH